MNISFIISGHSNQIRKACHQHTDSEKLLTMVTHIFSVILLPSKWGKNQPHHSNQRGPDEPHANYSVVAMEPRVVKASHT